MDTRAGEPLYDFTVQVKQTLEAERCTFWIVDRPKREVWSKVAIGLAAEEIIRLPMHRGVVGYVARTGQPLRLKDAYNDPRFDRTVDARTGYRTKSLLTMAVRNEKKQVVAVLQALNKEGVEGLFTDDDEAAMLRYCQEAATLLAKAPPLAP